MIVQHSQKTAAVIALLFALQIGQTIAAPIVPTPTPSATTTATSPTTTQAKPEPATTKPPTLETQFANLSKLSKTQSTRLDQLESANHDALTRNQTLQLENDNLNVQVKALQSDRSAQMFIYGAVAILVGAIIGYIIATQFFRRTRRW